MEIGKPKRVITIMPLENPVPQRRTVEEPRRPVKEPLPAKVPA